MPKALKKSLHMKKIYNYIKNYIIKHRAILLLFLIILVGFIYNSFSQAPQEDLNIRKATTDEPITVFIKPGLYGKTPEEKREYLLTHFENDNVIGDPNAEVTVIEYSSFTCNYCKAMRKEINRLVDEYAINEKKIKYVLRPLYNTRTIPIGAFLGCVSEKNKEKAIDYFFLKNIEDVENMEEFLIEAGKEFGMTEEVVKNCIYDEDTYKKLIYMQQETNTAFDIEGTPFLFINGEGYAGYKTSEKLKTIIDQKYEKNI